MFCNRCASLSDVCQQVSTPAHHLVAGGTASPCYPPSPSCPRSPSNSAPAHVSIWLPVPSLPLPTSLAPPLLLLLLLLLLQCTMLLLLLLSLLGLPTSRLALASEPGLGTGWENQDPLQMVPTGRL